MSSPKFDAGVEMGTEPAGDIRLQPACEPSNVASTPSLCRDSQTVFPNLTLVVSMSLVLTSINTGFGLVCGTARITLAHDQHGPAPIQVFPLFSSCVDVAQNADADTAHGNVVH